jgi:hypothetical protein
VVNYKNDSRVQDIPVMAFDSCLAPSGDGGRFEGVLRTGSPQFNRSGNHGAWKPS